MDDTTGTEPPVTTAGPFRSLGTSFAITTHDAVLTAALHELYAPMAGVEGVAASDGVPRDDGDTGAATVQLTMSAPTPGELWQLSVDGRTVVRSSTPGGVVRMVLQAVSDLFAHGSLPADRPADSHRAVRLRGTAIEVSGLAVLLLSDHRVEVPALVAALLDRHDGEVGYISGTAVDVDVDDRTTTGALTPLVVREGPWADADRLRVHVPAGLEPYLDDLIWPVPPSALGRVVSGAPLAAVLDLGIGAEAGSQSGAGDPTDHDSGVTAGLGAAAAVVRLLDRLPAADRAALSTEQLRYVATLVEQVASIELMVAADDLRAAVSQVLQAARTGVGATRHTIL